jgi:hypothetical protein
MRNAYNILIGKRKGKRPFGRICVYDRTIIKLSLKKYGGCV